MVGEEGRGECVEGGPWGCRTGFRTLLKVGREWSGGELQSDGRVEKVGVKDGLSNQARGGEWICSWCHAGEGVLGRQITNANASEVNQR